MRLNSQQLSGNALSEWALVSACIVLLAVPVWQLLSSATAHKLNFMQPRSLTSRYGPEKAPSDTQGAGNATGNRANGGNANQLCFANGICTISTADPRLTETAGAMGYNPILANASNLDILAQQLKLDGIDEDVSDWIGWLATNGHVMADIASAIESSTQGCPAGTFCPIEGNRWDASDLLKEIKNTKVDSDPSNGGNWKTASVGNFTDTYKRLLAVLQEKPNALNNYPQARAIIDASVQNIQNLIAGMEQQVVTQNGQTGVIQKNVATAKPINQNATTICNNGGKNCT